MTTATNTLSHYSRSSAPTRVDDLHVSEKRWFAVRTSNRHEKMALRELRRAGIECYIPLREKVCQYASKTVTRELPLLTGYVFVRIVKADELTVLRSHYARGFVKLGRERRRVQDAEIDILRKLSTDRALGWAEVESAFEFTQGTPVEIITGPLAGIRGYYQEKKSKKLFIISLSGLGACLSTCEVDPRMLVAINADRQLEGAAAHGNTKPLW